MSRVSRASHVSRVSRVSYSAELLSLNSSVISTNVAVSGDWNTIDVESSPYYRSVTLRAAESHAQETHADTHAYIKIHTQTYTGAHTQRNTHAHIHIYAHTHTHT